MTTIVARDEWGARPPKHRYPIDHMPTPELHLHHTGGDHRGAAGIRAIQDFHMDTHGWSDIGYSYIIDRRTLQIFEGRGAGIVGSHTAGRNRVSHAICVTGNFELHQPSDELLRKIAELVRHGNEQGWWPRQITGGHRDAPGASTACPGRFLHTAIPRINRYAAQEESVNQQHIERIERAIAELGYTVDIDGDLDDREADAVENMVEGINNLMADKQTLQRTVAELHALNDALRKQLEGRGPATDAIQAIQALGKALKTTNID